MRDYLTHGADSACRIDLPVYPWGGKIVFARILRCLGVSWWWTIVAVEGTRIERVKYLEKVLLAK